MIDIPGCEGKYAVTREGKVISHFSGKARKHSLDKDGYPLITIYDTANRPRTFRVHRLVALAYIPNPNNLATVNHIDCNKQNNHASNLEWLSHRNNTRHAALNNRMGKYSGGHRKRTLTLEQETVLREEYLRGGITQKEIGTKYGISVTTANAIIRCKR